MAEQLPDMALMEEPWRRRSGWRPLGRVIAGVTAFSLFLLQLSGSLVFAEHNQLPAWLKEEQGGWVSAEQAEGMHRADQQLLAFLSTLNNAVHRTTQAPDNLETLHANDRFLAARDKQQQILFTPATDPGGQVQEGTLVLPDGALQEIQQGRLTRQVDALGTETRFRPDGLADVEVAPDGTRTDFTYAFDEAGNLETITRTTHWPTGDVVQLYDSRYRLYQVRHPDGRAFTYGQEGWLESGSFGGFDFPYHRVAQADGSTALFLVDALSAEAYRLDQQLGLTFTGNDRRNEGGAGERWMQGAKGSWYFIKPDGALYRWAKPRWRKPLLSASTLVGRLSPVYHQNLELLYNAPAVQESPERALQQTAYALDQQLGLFFTGNDRRNEGGAGERWMQGAKGSWYFIKPDGALYRWAKPRRRKPLLSASTLVGRLSPLYHQNLELLYNAQPVPAPALPRRFLYDPAGRLQEVLQAAGANDPLDSFTGSKGVGQTVPFRWDAALDLIPPEVALTSAVLTNQASYPLLYTVDGAPREETVLLAEGENKITRTFFDPFGNAATVTWVITLDTIPPKLQLASADTTDAETYEAVIQADGEPLSTQTWRLGRGTHRLITEATDAAGNTAWARLAVTRTGDLPEPSDPPAPPQGNRLTQTLAAGSVATYVGGQLVQVALPDGTRLFSPALDKDGRITDGWLVTPEGTTTYLDNGAAVWSKTPLGAVYWYSPDGWLEAVRGADGSFTALAYRPAGEGEAILVSTDQESVLLSPKGEILQRVDADGRPLPLDETTVPQATLALLEDASGRIVGLSAEREGVTRFYDAAGRLTGLTLPDQSALKLAGETAEAIQLPDGTQVVEGVYDSKTSALISGRVILPDRREITYAAGQPTEARLPDGTTIAYAAGQPSRLVFSDGTAYTVAHGSHRPDATDPHWIASLRGPEGTEAISPAPDAMTRLVYSEDWVLQEATRADGAELAYIDGKLSILTQKDGTVISYAYDDAGRLANTVAASPDPAEPVIRTEYAYDKIRKIYKGGALIYDYTYEFEPDGAEITAIREPANGVVKRYRDGLLFSQTEPDGAVTTYEYTTDPAGSADPLTGLIQGRQVLSDGTVALYEKSGFTDSSWRITRLTRPDGSIVVDLTDPGQPGLPVGKALLPAEEAAVRRMVKEGTLRLTQPEASAWDLLKTATRALRSLSGGATAKYRRTGSGATDWKLDRLLLANGAEVTELGSAPSHLSDTTGVTSTAGVIGQAARFSAAQGQRLSLPDNDTVSMGNHDFTFASWVYVDGSTGTDQGVLSKVGGGKWEYMLDYMDKSKQFRLLVSADGTSTTEVPSRSAAGVQPGGWHFVAAWHDASTGTINLQVDNGAVDTVSHSGGVYNGTADFTVGARGGDYFNGRLDELAVWKRVLTTEERADLYGRGVESRGSLFTGLAAHWKMEEPSGERKDAMDFSALVQEAALPSSETSLRALVDSGSFKPDPLETALSAEQTLADGTVARYRPEGTADTRRLGLSELHLPDGTHAYDLTHPDHAATVQEAAPAWDRISAGRMVGQGALEAAPPQELDAAIESALGASRPYADGAVLHYARAYKNGPWSASGFTLPNGQRLEDLEKPAYALSDMNGAGHAQGVRGQAAHFSASAGQRLTHPDNPDFSVGGHQDFTFSAWVYLDGSTGTDQGVLSKVGGGKWEYMLDLKYNAQSNSHKFRFLLSPDGVNTSEVLSQSAAAVEPGRWHFVAAWHDASTGTINLQVDDGAVDSVSHADGVYNGSADFTVGTRGGDYFNGRLDELGFWKRVLTAEERTHLYQAPGTVPSEGLKALYRMEESSGARADATDLSAYTERIAEAVPSADRAAWRKLVADGVVTLEQPATGGGQPSAAAAGPVLSRATLSYHGQVRDTFTYSYSSGPGENGAPAPAFTHITDSSGITRTYNAKNRLVSIEQATGPSYSVSYARELSTAQEERLNQLPATSPERIVILQNPEGDEVVTHRLIRIVQADGSVLAEKDFPPDTLVQREFDSKGKLLSQTQANGHTTLFEDNRPAQTLDETGSLVTSFIYDAAGQLTQITLHAARRELADRIAEARADVPRRRAAALEELARQKGLAVGQLAAQAADARAQLDGQVSSLQQQLGSLEGTDVHGRSARRAKSQGLDQIRHAINTTRAAQGDFETQYAQSLGALESQVEQVRQQIETESNKAFADIAAQETQFTKDLLRQEIHPIVLSTYRDVIGRDPSDAELDQEVEILYAQFQGSPDATVDITSLQQRIIQLPDYAGRVAQVAAIKQQVFDRLTQAAQGPDTLGTLATELGLSATQVVALTAADAGKILEWVDSRGMHFGHSAFLALQEYLAGQGIQTDLVALAVESVLTDVLTGTIHPKTQGDLEISLFTLKHLARLHGAEATPAQISFEDLAAMLAAGEGIAAPVIAHINGNHYILVTGVDAEGNITYRELNTGATGQTLTMTREQFQEVWKGVVLAPRAPPPAWQTLTDQEAQKITGSFFPLLFLLIAQVVSGIFAAVTTVLSAVAGFLASLGSLITGVFNAFSAAFAGFFQGLGAIFSGNLIGGIATIGKAFFTGLGLLIEAGISFLGIGSLAELGTAAGVKALGAFAVKTIVATGLSVSVSKGLEALGVDPGIASLAGAFVGGGVTGFLNPADGIARLTSAAYGAVTSTAVAGTQLGLVKAGLDPNLASLAGIGVGTITSSLTSGVNITNPVTGEITGHLTGLNALGYTLSTQLAPTLAGELAFYGIQRLGESVGLDPRLSQLAGISIKHGIGNIAKTGNDAKNVLQGMQDGLTRGALQVGLSFATQDLDPLLGGLASSAVTGAIDGLITAQNPLDPNSERKGIFAGIGDTFTRAVGGFTAIGKVVPGDPVTTAQNLAQLNDFSNIIREQGLGAAVETYATSLLYRSSVESLISAGNNFSIQQAINTQLQDPNNRVELDGQSVIQISLGTDANGNRKYLWVDPTSHGLVASLQGQDYIRYIAAPKVDPTTRTAGAVDTEITRTLTNPLTGEQIATKIRLEAAGADWIEIQDKTGTLYRITPNSFQNVGLNADGTLKDGILNDQRTSRQFYFQNGELVKTVTPTKVTVDTPAGAKELVAQVQTNAQGQTEVKVDRMEMADEIVRATMGKSLQQLEEEARTSPSAAGQLKNFWERVRNVVTWQGFKTDEQLALEKAQAIDAIVKVGRNGDILMVGGPGIISIAIRETTFAPVNHAGYLERDDNGRLWVIDINPRSLGKKDGVDFLRTPFEEWAQRQTVIVAGRPNVSQGENPVGYLERVYGLNSDGRTFAQKGPRYNYFGALFGGLPLIGDVTRDDPNRKFCSELVCDTQVVTGNELPGLPPNSWRTPGSLWRALPQWGKNLRDLVPSAQADEGNSS